MNIGYLGCFVKVQILGSHTSDSNSVALTLWPRKLHFGVIQLADVNFSLKSSPHGQYEFALSHL
jgi:hypothetical protein